MISSLTVQKHIGLRQYDLAISKQTPLNLLVYLNNKNVHKTPQKILKNSYFAEGFAAFLKLGWEKTKHKIGCDFFCLLLF